MSKHALRLFVWCGVIPALVGSGCSPEETRSPGGLVVATTTDLQIPKDVTHIGIQVISTKGGVTRSENWYPLGAGPEENRLPATLAIEPGQTDDPVRIRLFARKAQSIISISESVTTVPRNRVALLRMPIEWLSAGMVAPTAAAIGTGGTSSTAPSGTANGGAAGTTDTSVVPFPDFVSFKLLQSSCPEGQAPRAGTCTSTLVKSESLPTYTAGQVFGTGSGNGDGVCFDTGACFATVNPIAIVDRASCLAAPTTGVALNPTKFSIGLVTADGAGICGSAGCIVPLDLAKDPTNESGWTFDNKGIHLPPAVCRKLDEGKIRAVVSTSGCDSKVPSIPTCGPWSSVNTKKAVATSNAELLALCWQFAASSCAGIGRCRGGSGFIPGVVQDGGDCTERMRFLCDASLATPEAEGFRRYFAECADAYESATCELLELKSRTACVEPEATVNAKGLGESCTFGQCAAGLTCLGAIPNGAGKCTQRYTATSNAACGTGTPIDAVLPQGACAAGLLCDPVTQRCHVPGLIGESCTVDQSCEVGAVCVDASCTAEKPLNALCGDDSQCGPGLHCIQTSSNSGQCRGPGELGASCTVLSTDQTTTIWQENLCDLTQSLRCDRLSQTCQPAKLLAPGASCTTLNTCAGGYCSGLLGGNESSWTCLSYLSDGATCSSTSQCAPPAECLDRQCRLRPAFGVNPTTMQAVPGAVPCAAGRSTCSEGCVDLATDRNNCGVCGNACPIDMQCVAGACDCGSKAVKCTDGCRDLQSDPKNCGKCDHVCASDSSCMSGVCTPTCGEGLTACGTVCANLSTDSANCGKCGNACQASATCSKGECQPLAGTGGTSGQGGASSVGGMPGTTSALPIGGTSGQSKTSAVALGGTTSAMPSSAGTAGSGIAGSAGSVAGAAGSTFTATCPAVPAAAGTSGTSTPPLSVTAEGYVTSGKWQGYVEAAVDSASSTTSVPKPVTSVTTTGITLSVCVNGTVAPSNDATRPGWAKLGFKIHQTSDGTIVTASPTSAGMRVVIDNRNAAKLRAQIYGAPSVDTQGRDTTEHWCAPISNGTSNTPSTLYIPWTSFKKNCETAGGAAYRGEALSAVAVVVPQSTDSSPVAFDYCVNGLGEVGATSPELVSSAGWIGGDAASTSDDPMGIQGSFWTAGDGIAYTAIGGNPCSLAGCCLKGKTVVDSTRAAWGASLGMDLRWYKTGQPEGSPSACPYRGTADCFDAVFSGTTGGSSLAIMARATNPAALPKGESDPQTLVPPFSNGWSGRVCLADLTCQSWSPHCKTSNDWFNLEFQVNGGEVAGDFDLCLTSLKAVDDR